MKDDQPSSPYDAPGESAGSGQRDDKAEKPWLLYLILTTCGIMVLWIPSAVIIGGATTLIAGSIALVVVIGPMARAAAYDTGRNYFVRAAVLAAMAHLVGAVCLKVNAFPVLVAVGAALPAAAARLRVQAAQARAIRDDDQRALFSRPEPPPLASTAKVTRILCDSCHELVDAATIERVDGAASCATCRGRG